MTFFDQVHERYMDAAFANNISVYKIKVYLHKCGKISVVSDDETINVEENISDYSFSPEVLPQDCKNVKCQWKGDGFYPVARIITSDEELTLFLRDHPDDKDFITKIEDLAFTFDVEYMI